MKGLNGINYAENNDTKMFVIPSGQRDPVMAAYLVNQLRKQGIEVYEVKDRENEFVVPLNQPYSRFAFDLLTRQKYPKDAKFPPYDAIAWTLGLNYGVDVQQVDSLKYASDDLVLLNEDVRYKGKISGSASSFIIDYKAQSSVITGLCSTLNQIPKLEALVLDSLTVDGNDSIPPGTIILKGLSENDAKNFSDTYGIDLSASNVKFGHTHKIELPRIAIYHSWYDTQAEGWVRYTFEQKQIPYISIDKDDLRIGMLRNNFDVIIIPQTRGDFADFMHGVDDRFGPIPFTKTKDYPSHGYPDSTDDMTGGPGFEGLKNLNEFVKQGGVLVPLDNSSSIIAESGITNKVSSFSTGGLFHPGSIVTVKTRNSKSPILYGYPEIFHVFKGNGKLLGTEKYDRDIFVLQYGTKPLKDEEEYKGKILGQKESDINEIKPLKKDSIRTQNTNDQEYVLSGMVRNENEIVGNAAILNVPVGDGRIVFFTFNPLNRYLNHYDSSLLWNVLINWKNL